MKDKVQSNQEKYIDLYCQDCEIDLVIDIDYSSSENEIDGNMAYLNLICVECGKKFQSVFKCIELKEITKIGK